jgi:glycosyltransferase involved in cell wall biosynthesis
MSEHITPVHVLATMRLTDVKTGDKLLPLLKSSRVRRVTLVRYRRVNVESDKLTQVTHDLGEQEAWGEWPVFTGLRNTWKSFWSMLGIARRQKPEVILAFFLVPHGLVAWLVARLTGRRAVVSLIGADFNRHVKGRIVGYFMQAVLRNCDAVVVFGPTVKEELIRYGVRPDHIFVLPNTANTDLFRPDADVHPDIDLIFVGNFIARKRVDLLLQALKAVHETRPQTRLLLVGDGEERARLEALAEALGLTDAVEFHGQSARVVDQLRRARVFVLLSTSEGLPMAMVEAMCTGLPVVVTDVGANATVVRDGENGYLVPSPADPALVAGRILRLLEDSEHYQQARQAALRVQETHRYERAARVWDTILDSLN